MDSRHLVELVQRKNEEKGVYLCPQAYESLLDGLDNTNVVSTAKYIAYRLAQSNYIIPAPYVESDGQSTWWASVDTDGRWTMDSSVDFSRACRWTKFRNEIEIFTRLSPYACKLFRHALNDTETIVKFMDMDSLYTDSNLLTPKEVAPLFDSRKFIWSFSNGIWDNSTKRFIPNGLECKNFYVVQSVDYPFSEQWEDDVRADIERFYVHFFPDEKTRWTCKKMVAELLFGVRGHSTPTTPGPEGSVWCFHHRGRWASWEFWKVIRRLFDVYKIHVEPREVFCEDKDRLSSDVVRTIHKPLKLMLVETNKEDIRITPSIEQRILTYCKGFALVVVTHRLPLFVSGGNSSATPYPGCRLNYRIVDATSCNENEYESSSIEESIWNSIHFKMALEWRKQL